MYRNLTNSCGIYKFHTPLTTKVYIGSSKNIRKRVYMHLWFLKKNQHHSKRLQSFFNKYGEENLQVETLELCEEKDLANKEQYWIDSFDSYIKGFNGTPKAETHEGKIVTDTHKKAISIANTGRKKSDLALRTFKEKCQNKSHTKEANDKRSASHKGKKMTQESINKRLATLKAKGGYQRTEKQKEAARNHILSLHKDGRVKRKIKVTDDQVKEIRELKLQGITGRELSKRYNITESVISRIINNQLHK